MSLIWKLFVAQARLHKVRLALTAFAMVAAVGVVLWVVSAYEVVASKFDEQTNEFVGSYSLFVAPKYLEDGLSKALCNQLAQHPAVESANTVSQFRMWFRRIAEDAESPPESGRGLGRLGPTVVGTDSLEPRYPLIDGRWLHADEEAAVVSSGVAEALSLKPGDRIEFKTKGPPVALPVVGITQQVDEVEFAMTRTKGGAPGGTNRGPASLAAYVPLAMAEKLVGTEPKVNLVELRLRPQASADELASVVAASNPPADLIRPDDVKAKLASGFEAEGARKRAYFVTALSILASAFIIFTTLSMGVSERARQLAVLRAVGLKRTQIAQLVLAEALTLAVFGWIGGLAGGYLLLQALASSNPALFPDGVTLGRASIVLTGLCSLLGALLASLLPIWKAVRISPLEAMTPIQAATYQASRYLLLAAVGLLLIGLNPLLVFMPNVPESLRFLMVLGLGVPATVLGFILLAPLSVIVVENIFTPLVSGLLRLHGGLVRTQLSNNMWRSAGIAASLTLGLGLYTATQVWGWSMLGGFLPGRWTPNTIVLLQPGLPEEQIDKVRSIPGINPDSFLPVAVEQAKLVGDPLKSGDLDSAVRQDNVVVVGVDVEAAFGGKSPLFNLTLTEGDWPTALKKLRQGRHCVVPDTFTKFAGLHVGDTIGLIPPKAPERPVEYTIAAIAHMPGSNWITKTTGLRKQSVRTAGLVFASREPVREDFDLKLADAFWFNARPGVTTDDLRESFAPFVSTAATPTGGRRGPQGSRTRGDSKSETARPDRAAGRPSPPGGGNAGRGGRNASRRGGGPFGSSPVQVTSLAEVRDGLRSRGGSAVQAMGWLPLITLVVVSLGVVNTVAASVRARRWEFGILRAVGLNRWGLTRLVLSEALLIAFVASLLSLAFGILTGWTCLGLVRYVSNPWFEGVATPLTIPWSAIGYGYGLTFVLCFLAALWPAVSSGRSEPLALLQSGRASA